MLSISDLELFQAELSDPEVRALRIEAQSRAGIPLQIRAMREIRGLTQEKLAEKIGTTQNTISRLENPKSTTPNISTLERLAVAFDVGLIVQFVPFSQFFDFHRRATKDSVAIPSFAAELSDIERRREQGHNEIHKPEYLGAPDTRDETGQSRISPKMAASLIDLLQRWYKTANLDELREAKSKMGDSAKEMRETPDSSLNPPADPQRQVTAPPSLAVA
jgi:transcriptional regulator with XRE-family HTH domain